MRLTGELLNAHYGLGFRQARYREDGKWYHHLDQFPGALFDAFGYVGFKSVDEYRDCDYLQLGQDLHVIAEGISSMPGYCRLDPPPIRIA